MPEQPESTAPSHVLLYETRQVKILLEQRGVYMERETLSTISDILGLVTRPPDNDRLPRRWTMTQIEFIAAAAAFLKLRPTKEPLADLANDGGLLARYVEEVQASAERVAELAMAAHAEDTAAIHSTQSSSKTRAA